MCYAIPGRIVSIDGKTVTVNYFGEQKKAFNELDGLKVGDYIYAQGGYAIKSLPLEEAQSILSVWKETFFELQELDLRLSKINLQKKGVPSKIIRLLDRAVEGRALSYEDYLSLLQTKNPETMELLYKTANFLRRKHLDNSCCVHGIIEYSNYCKRNCEYCGISTHNKSLSRYRMTDKEILSVAEEAIETYGFQAIVMQSGEDDEFTPERLANIIAKIKQKHAVLIFVSPGEIGIEGLKKLYLAGARGLLMRFETSNPQLYKKLHPGYLLETRLNHIREAYRMGYLIITGSIIGIPGQEDKDILNDIFLARELNAEMYSFGPFVPHPESPLGVSKTADSQMILKTLALSRLIDPENAKILVTTAFETIDKTAREKGLMAGANSVMLNVTPHKMKKDYSIYPKRAHDNETLAQQIDTTLSLLSRLGRAPTDLGIKERV